VNDLGLLNSGIEVQHPSITPAAAEGAIAKLCDRLKRDHSRSPGDHVCIAIGDE
jgi:hypothetical protein